MFGDGVLFGEVRDEAKGGLFDEYFLRLRVGWVDGEQKDNQNDIF